MARTQKLKVFRTPIGFHDAYVAAPSRKAALKAWGSDADLFARGVAEEITDTALMRAPLDRPGEVIRVARGSAAEHLAAATTPPAKTKMKAPARPRAETAMAPPRPSRKALDAAEDALNTLDSSHRQAVDELNRQAKDLERELAAIERKRRDLDAEYDRARADAQGTIDRERQRHATALDAWLTAQA